MTVTETHLDAFMAVYCDKLREAVVEFPEHYVYPVSDVPAVCARMRPAIARGSFSKDSHAIRRTCAALGIAHTYKAISAFLAGAHD